MAEAHSAVAFSFSVSSEGFTYDINSDAIKAIIKSSICSWKSSVRRLKMLVKLLQGRKPRLFSYQSSLPSLPLPRLKDTLDRYLLSVKELHTEESFLELQQEVGLFLRTNGRRFQFFLNLKYWLTGNYVTDWWETYIYLANRMPLMSNSNYYGLDSIWGPPGNPTQAARAAFVVYHAIQIRDSIVHAEMSPIMLMGTVPLCSLQYERQFNTTRIPRAGVDKLKHWNNSDHIAVYHRGRYFKCPVSFAGRYLMPVELELLFESILKDQSEPSPGEEKLAAMTAGPRDDWAAARGAYFSAGVNKTSLNIIETAAFFVTLDDIGFGCDFNNLGAFAKSALCGKTYDRWFDKSFNVIVFKDSKFAANSEHSWADAPITSHAVESVLLHEFTYNAEKKPYLHYVDGHCDGTPEVILKPTRLRWKIPEQCLEVIESSYQIARTLADSVDLVVRRFNKFGKGFMKKHGLSPDAFLQMSFQLAYFMDYGEFCLTYESSMVRMYREGRTETVRSCSSASCSFVRAALNKIVSVTEKRDLLKAACDSHQRLFRDAMVGKGVDRHLFALYVVSKFLKTDSTFLRGILNEPWRLSTSQTPIHQCANIDYPTGHAAIGSTPGGGFGPVADNGYGVSYIFAGENHVFIHVSSYKTCEETNSEKFQERIFGALEMMRRICELDENP